MREEFNKKIDNIEQRSRKVNLRIEGIEVTDGETNANLTDKITKALNTMGTKVSGEDIFRAHRSGRTITRDNKRVAQTIVSFRSWSARTRAFDTRYAGTWEERKKRPYFVRHDLTKRRQQLLKSAQDHLEKHPHAHAYANRECNLFIMNRSSGEQLEFNDTQGLHDALSAIDEYEPILLATGDSK